MTTDVWETLEGGHASAALWMAMTTGLAAALIGWALILANRKSLGGQARARARLGYTLMIAGLLAFAGGPEVLRFKR